MSEWHSEWRLEARRSANVRYRREIDGLRALAVVPVVLFHAGMAPFSGGFVGVDVLFVISGYLITSLIVAERQAGRFSLIRFYERRARRILPALFLVMLLCLPCAWLWLLASDMQDFSQSLIGVSTFTSNLLFWRESGYFDTASELKPLLHTWSLAVEEQYYVFFPLIFALVWSWGRKPIAILFLCVGAASLAFAEWTSRTHAAFAFFLLPTRTWELLLGALLGLRSTEPVPRATVLHEILALLGLLLIAVAVFGFDAKTPFPGVYALVPTLGAATVIAFATNETRVGLLLGSRPLVGAGLLSYSIYLWHQPIFAFARHRSVDGLQLWELLLGAIASVVLAYFSWKYVETPLRSSRTTSRKQVFALAVSGSFLFVVIGSIGVATDGFLARFKPSDQPLAQLGFRTGKYVERRFLDRTLKSFENNGKRKVLIVGDSFGEDLVNAIAETGLSSTYQISTRHIATGCGNLYLPDAFKAQIDPRSLAACENAGWYEGPRMRSLMTEADEIWLASSWQLWQAQLIGESVARLQADFGPKIRVFGTKSFGTYSIKSLVGGTREELAAIERPVSPWIIAVNERMKSSLPANVFVDVLSLLCGGDPNHCRLFTPEGRLVSFDGSHLTPDGARFYGEKLAGVRDLSTWRDK